MNISQNYNPPKRVVKTDFLNVVRIALFFLFVGTGLCQAKDNQSQTATISTDITEDIRVEANSVKEAPQPNQSPAKKKRVTGVVTDKTGMPLIGVNVMFKNVSGGTTTNVDGLFVLEASPKDVLVFSYIGFLSKEVKVGDKMTINVTLDEDAQSLEEVVVIGYGKQTKASVVSSMSSIGEAELNIPTRSLSGGIAGRLPGLISVQRSGEPGYDDAEFWIRGVSTFAGGSSPLILVDGVPREMNNIEPDEIETFSVLKDAAATAVYGAEGANGVVLITTKRGKVAKPVISFRGEYSLSSPTRLPEFVDSWQYLDLANEALRNDGLDPQFSDELIAKYRNNEDPDLYPNAKWMDEILAKNYSSQRYTINARGGSDFAKYFVSMAYYTENGAYKNNSLERYDNNIKLERYNLRSNIDMKVSKSTKIAVDISGQYLTRTSPNKSANDIFGFMLWTPSYIFPAIYSDGTISTYQKENDNNERNPYNFVMNSGYQRKWSAKIQSSVKLDQDLYFITPGLKFRGLVSFDYDGTFDMERGWNPNRYYATGRDDNGDLIFNKTFSGQQELYDAKMTSSGTRKIYVEGSLNYDRTFGKHVVNAMLLYNQKDRQYHDVAISYKKQGVVGRAAYSYDNRYFIEANFGYTGSETFAKDRRFGFFPAVGLGYYISNEKFYPSGLSNVMNKLKLRASIGRTGNDDTGSSRFLYRATFDQNAYNFSQGYGTSGSLNALGAGIHDLLFVNNDIHWEVEEKRNFGVDLGFFGNKIEIIADYFNNRRHDILMQRKTIPGTAGFWAAPWDNFGIVDNQGFDGSIDIRHNFGPVKMTLRGTFSYAHNKIVEYDELEPAYPWMKLTGNSIGDKAMYIAERLYTEDDFIATQNTNGTYSYKLKEGLPQVTMPNLLGPGDIKFKDLNNDGIIDNMDKTYGIKDPKNPEISYGFGINLEYKNFYVNAFFQGTGKSQILLAEGNNVFWPFNWGIEKSNYRTAFLDRWTAENPDQNALMPRLHSKYANNVNKEPNTWWLRDASFLRFKNLEVGYNFPEKVARKLLLNGARVYLMGNNLCVWDKIKYWDPELSNNNNGNTYPLSRTFTVGLEINF